MKRRVFLVLAPIGVIGLCTSLRVVAATPSYFAPRPVPALFLGIASRCKGRRCVADLLADETIFLAHVMTYGGAEDIAAAERFYTHDGFRRVLQMAPAKIFDPMSWHFWHWRLFDVKPPRKPYDWFGFHRKVGKRLVTAAEISQGRYGD